MRKVRKSRVALASVVIGEDWSYYEPVILLELTEKRELPLLGTVRLAALLNSDLQHDLQRTVRKVEYELDGKRTAYNTYIQNNPRRYHRSKPITIAQMLDVLKREFWPAFDKEVEAKKARKK